jgi:hypothetical protein
MSKKSSYKPEAKDGDNDGLVQDGTVWERPAEESEPALQSPVSPVEATTPAEKVKTHTCTDSDSYASLSAQFCPKGMTKHQYALELVKKNSNKALRPGATIIL